MISKRMRDVVKSRFHFRLKELIAFIFVHNHKSFEHTAGIKYWAVGMESYIALYVFI